MSYLVLAVDPYDVISSGKCVLPARTDMNFDLQVLRVCKLADVGSCMCLAL